MGSEKGGEHGSDQQDLFSELIQNSESKQFARTAGEAKPPVTLSINLDKIIVFVLMFMMMFAVVFFCGIEAGKKMTRDHGGQSNGMVLSSDVKPNVMSDSVKAVLPANPVLQDRIVHPVAPESSSAEFKTDVTAMPTTVGSTETIQLPMVKVESAAEIVTDLARATTDAVDARRWDGVPSVLTKRAFAPLSP